MSGSVDEKHMRQAVALTEHCPDLPFGTVIVHAPTGRVVAEGWNRTDENPLLHGEVDALTALHRGGWRGDTADLTLYTTAEPCPMCMGAILFSGIGRVVYGTSIRFLLDTGWEQIDLPAEEIVRRGDGFRCELVGGVLQEECDDLFLAVCRAAPGR